MCAVRAYALVARSDLALNGRRAAVPDALALEIHLGPLPLLHGQTLDGDRIKLLGIDDPSAKESATRGGLAAYLRLAELGLVHRDSDIASKGVFFDLGMDARISGNSAGLAFLAATAGWILEDYLSRSGKVCPAVSVAATGILPNVGATDQIRILIDPIKEVASLGAKIAAGTNAVGHQGYVMYPACAEAPEFAPDGRHIVVATANDAVDRIIELYGVRQRRRRLRRPVRRARTLPLAMAMAVVAVLTGWLLREKPPPPPPPVPLTVTLFQESRSGEPVIVPPTTSLRAGDGIRVRLELEALALPICSTSTAMTARYSFSRLNDWPHHWAPARIGRPRMTSGGRLTREPGRSGCWRPLQRSISVGLRISASASSRRNLLHSSNNKNWCGSWRRRWCANEMPGG